MFSENLKNLRKDKGITQEELADAIFVSRSVIAKYETGISYPSKENLEKLALYFNVKVEELIHNSETTLEFANSKSIFERVNYICLIIVSIFSFIISVFVFMPVFKGQKYVYPIPPGESQPQLEHFFASIFTGTYNYGNFIGLVLFIISIVVGIFSIFTIIYRHKKCCVFLSLTTYLLFIVVIFLLFISIVICFSYIT